jgi:hypothetical protein
MKRKALERSVRIAVPVLALAVVTGMWYSALAAGLAGDDAASIRIAAGQSVVESTQGGTAVLWGRLRAIAARLRAAGD